MTEKTALETLRNTNLPKARWQDLEHLCERLWSDETDAVNPDLAHASSLLIAELGYRRTRLLFWISTLVSIAALILAALSVWYAFKALDAPLNPALVTQRSLEEALLKQHTALLAAQVKSKPSSHEVLSLLTSLQFKPTCHEGHVVWKHPGPKNGAPLFVYFAARPALPPTRTFYFEAADTEFAAVLNAMACP